MGLVKLGYPGADPLLALGLVGFIVYIAVRIVRGAVVVLADSAQIEPSAVRQAAESLEGVVRITEVRSRGLETAVFVDLRVEVLPELSLRQAHDLSHRVEAAIRAAFPEVVDVVTHIEPAGASGPKEAFDDQPRE